MKGNTQLTSYSRISQLPPSDFVPFCRMNRYMERFSLPHTQPFAAARQITCRIRTYGITLIRLQLFHFCRITHAAYAYRVNGILALSCVLITIPSSVFLSTSPNHLGLASLIRSHVCATPALALTYSVPIFSILFISIIDLGIFISVLS